MAYEKLQETARQLRKLQIAADQHPEVRANQDMLANSYLKAGGFSSVDEFEQAINRYKAAGQGRTKPALSGPVGQAVQGVTLGGSDEIIAGIRSFAGTPYDEALAAERYSLEEGQREHPTASLMAQVGAGGAVGGLIGMAPKTVGGGIMAATGAGGVAGFASGEGGLANRAINAAMGAGIGGLAGLGTAAAGAGIRKVAAPAMVGLGLATEKMSERMALRKLAQSFDRDRITPTPTTGAKPETLVDRGGENLMGLARASQALPSEARQAGRAFLTDRAEGQTARVMDDLQSSIGVQPDGLNYLDNIVLSRKARANTLFEEAFDDGTGNPIVMKTDFLKPFANRPAYKDALERAARIAAEEGKTLPAFAPGDEVPLRVLHWIKLGIQDSASAAKKPGSSIGSVQLGAIKQTAKDFRDALVNEADNAVGPAYRRALDTFAGDVALEEAFEAGGTIMAADARATARTVSGMSQGEKDAFLVGAMDAIRRTVAKTPDGADVVKRVFGSQEKRDIIRNLFPDDQAFMEFAQKMAAEKGMRRTQDVVLGGSPTARITAEVEDLGQDPFSILADVFSASQGGSLIDSALRAGSKHIVTRAQGINNAVADKLSSRLFEADPARQAAILREIEAQRVMDARKTRRPVSQFTGGLLGVQYPLASD